MDRFATQRLTALAQAQGALAKPVTEALFVCDTNAGRSQMAAALALHRGQGRLNARAADIVITLGCGGACPITPGQRYLDWPVPDPASRPVTEIRRIRDELDLLVTELLAGLPAQPSGGP